jgi:hypothetical protein
MAGVKGLSEGGGEALLRRLRRLTNRAGAVDPADRAQLLALLDDIERVRHGLLRECTRLDEEMKRATVRVTAISAYARGAISTRGSHRGGRQQNGSDT